MKTLLRAIEHDSRSDEFHFYPEPDVHLGNAECDEKAIAAWAQQIADDPLALWVGMGDYCEFINRKDRRYEEEAVAHWLWGVGDIAKAQRERYIETHLPIASKCVALVRGNHEDTIQQYTERDVFGPIVEAISQAAGGAALSLDYRGFVRLIFQRKHGDGPRNTYTVDCFLTHGWWAGRLQGNGALNLERLGGWVWAQIVLAGHDHKLKGFPQVVLKPCKNGKVEEMRQVCGGCGTFLDGARYGERAGYRPAAAGYLTIAITPDKHKITITQ